jgi:hypothetical protein
MDLMMETIYEVMNPPQIKVLLRSRRRLSGEIELCNTVSASSSKLSFKWSCTQPYGIQIPSKQELAHNSTTNLTTASRNNDFQ